MKPKKLQKSVSVKEFRKVYDAYVASHGDWKEVCGVRNTDVHANDSRCCACPPAPSPSDTDDGSEDPFRKINTNKASEAERGSEGVTRREVRDAAAAVIALTVIILGVRTCMSRGERSRYRPL